MDVHREDMHCQFVTSHLECRVRLKFLSLNAYSPIVFPSCSHKVPNDAPNKVPQASYHISPRVFFFNFLMKPQLAIVQKKNEPNLATHRGK
jgi:hypothetical protein